jgi:hypothetical protein
MCTKISDCKSLVLEYLACAEIHQQFPCEDTDVPEVRMGPSQLNTQYPSELVPFQTDWQQKTFIAMFNMKY